MFNGQEETSSRKRAKRALQTTPVDNQKCDGIHYSVTPGSTTANVYTDDPGTFLSCATHEPSLKSLQGAASFDASWDDYPAESPAKKNEYYTRPTTYFPRKKERQPPTSENEKPIRTSQLPPLYLDSTEAPSRVPAHKPVRLKKPKHALAAPGTPVYFKYGDEHYPEETVPEQYTARDPDGSACRYIVNFLVYNKRGERLLPIEVLDQTRHSSLVLYGSLLIVNDDGWSTPGGEHLEVLRARPPRVKRRVAKTRSPEDAEALPPYPIRAELATWCIDYGPTPESIPYMWLVSKGEVYYRLERPAGRYASTFASAKLKFEVATRVIKTLQAQPDVQYSKLVHTICAAAKHHPKVPRPVEDMNRTDSLSGDDGDDASCRKRRASSGYWLSFNGGAYLSTSEGTGLEITDADGTPGPLTTWGAPYAVAGLRHSTLLSLVDFLETQIQVFSQLVAPLKDNRFVLELRQKAALRRDTLQLIETKKRSIESMLNASAYQPQLPTAPTATYTMVEGIPMPAPCTLDEVAQGIPAIQNHPAVVLGIALDGGLTQHQHRALLLEHARRQEERELAQLEQLLRELSDSEDQPPRFS